MKYNPTKVTASLVLYHNDKGQVNTLLDCFKQANGLIDCCLYVIDNSDNRECFKWLDKPPLDDGFTIKYTYIGKNLGFGSAHNLAIHMAIANKSELHLICNPDVTFTPNDLNILVTYLNQNPKAVGVGPKLVYPLLDKNRGGQWQYSARLLPTPLDLFLRRFGGQLLRKITDAQYDLKKIAVDKPTVVPVLSGAFILLKADVLNKINGFDSRFFMYLEDVDLCRRASEYGDLVFLPTSVVTHDHGQGSYKSIKLLSYHIRSTFYYFNKWGWFFDKKRRVTNQNAIFEITHKH